MSYNLIFFSIIFVVVAASYVAWYLHKHDINPPFL